LAVRTARNQEWLASLLHCKIMEAR
jgi:hypothetical protein